MAGTFGGLRVDGTCSAVGWCSVADDLWRKGWRTFRGMWVDIIYIYIYILHKYKCIYAHMYGLMGTAVQREVDRCVGGSRSILKRLGGK